MTSQSWFSRLIESIKGVVVGIILFLVAFPLLFWGEGRAVKRAQDLTEGRGAVVSVAAESVDAANEGELVHLNGLATTDETLTDSEFNVTSESTIALERQVEMYQWEEDVKTETVKKAGGSEETRKTYSYNKVWSSNVINSSSFHTSQGHENPGSMTIEKKTSWASEVTLGAFNLGSLTQSISTWEDLSATSEVELDLSRPLSNIDGGYYYGNDPGSPEIGDQRIRFRIIKPTDVSVIAVQTGDTFTPYKGSSGSSIFRLNTGLQSADEMFEQMEAENTMMLWMIRLGGFILMFVGISAVFKPLVVVADVIPFFGNLLEMGVSVLAFIIAFPLTLITIAIGWVAYRPLVGIVLLLVAGAVIAGGIKMANDRKKQRPDNVN